MWFQKDLNPPKQFGGFFVSGQLIYKRVWLGRNRFSTSNTLIMTKPKSERVEWLIRAQRNMTHKNVGRTLAGNQDELSDPGALRFEVKTNDGVWNMWSCGERNFADSKAIVLDFLGQGEVVFLYKKIGEAYPFRFEDEEIKQAMQSIGAREVPLPSPKKSKAHKAAEKRLKELQKKRKHQGVH